MWPEESRVTVFPLSRQPEGDEIIVGRMETNTFLALSEDAVSLLDSLSAGATIGEAKQEYVRLYGEVPDLADFLDVMEEKGFLAPRNESADPIEGGADKPSETGWTTWLTPAIASRLTSFPVVLLSLALISVSVCAVILDPSLIPRPSSAYFADDRSIKLIILIGILYASTFVHELGHLIAARAVGLKPTIGIGHRMWILVLETDITGLWAMPKKKRLLPILAGCLVDAVMVAGLLLFVAAHRRGWVAAHAVADLAWALAYLMLLRLLWQFFFFMRTDIYFLVAHIFSCKNLMADTQEYLKSKLQPLMPKLKVRNLETVSRRERRVIRSFSILWLVGRGVAFYALFFLTLPVAFLYLRGIWTDLATGLAGNEYRFVDSLIVASLYLIPFCAGVFLWIRSLMKSWKETLWTGKA